MPVLQNPLQLPLTEVPCLSPGPIHYVLHPFVSHPLFLFSFFVSHIILPIFP